MFDSTPNNLPVEPTRPAAPPQTDPQLPPLAPPLQMPSPSAPKPMSAGGRKEPEDIFSGLDQAGQPRQGAAPSLPHEPRGRSPLFVIGIVIAILVILSGIGFAAWSYFGAEPAAEPIVTNTNAPSTIPLPTEEQLETPPAITETPSPVVTTPPDGTQVPVPTFPEPTPVVTAPTEGTDTDGDSLTDVEEPYYDADPLRSDSDGDGYTDGNEVTNLFSPAASGALLVNAPFMNVLPWNAWTFLAPKPWSVVPDVIDVNVASVLLGTATKFTFTKFANPNKQPLGLWLTSQSFEAPRSIALKSGLEARQSTDGLTTYVASGDSVLRVAYDLNGDPAYQYRMSYAVLLNSLTLPKP